MNQHPFLRDDAPPPGEKSLAERAAERVRREHAVTDTDVARIVAEEQSRGWKADLDVTVQMQCDACESVRMPVVYDSIGIGVQFANVFAYVHVLAQVLEHQIRRLEDLEDRLAGHSRGSQRFRWLERKER